MFFSRFLHRPRQPNVPESSSRKRPGHTVNAPRRVFLRLQNHSAPGGVSRIVTVIIAPYRPYYRLLTVVTVGTPVLLYVLFFFLIIPFTFQLNSYEVLPAIFWISSGHRCRPFSPPVRAFNFYRA